MKFENGIDLSIANDLHHKQPTAFGLPRATETAFRDGDFVGDVTEGGSVNCRMLYLAPHGNGTHTESISHIVETLYPVCDVVPLAPFLCTVVSVPLLALGKTHDSYDEGDPDDFVIPAFIVPDTEGLVIRTTPNDLGKTTRVYTDPAYLTANAMERIAASPVRHLLVDVPSVDRASDDGTLRNHRTFWNVPLGLAHATNESRFDRTITEMIFVPDEVPDGLYWCWIGVPRIETDAMMSRVVLFSP